MSNSAYKRGYNAIDWSDTKPISRWRSDIPKARGDFPLPLLLNDKFDTPVLGMDGQMYESKRAMSATHKRMGYNEMGNEAPSKPEAPKVDRRARREELRAVIHDVKNGNVPDAIKAIE